MNKPKNHLSLIPREFSVQALKSRIEHIKEAKSELLIEAMCTVRAIGERKICRLKS